MTDEHRDADTTPDPPPVQGGQRGRATRPGDPTRPCLNCGDPRPGQYCPSCGQRKVEVRVSVRTLVMDVLEDQFILDRRLPRTLGALFFKPGRLTIEHVNGRIARYIHPFRLYLVSSLLFFLVLSFFSLRLVRNAMQDDGPAQVRLEDGQTPSDALADVQAQLADTTLDDTERQALEEAEALLIERRHAWRLDSLGTAIAEIDSALAQVDSAAAQAGLPAPTAAALAAGRANLERRRTVALARRDTLQSDSATAPGGPADEDRTLAEMFEWDQDGDPPTVSVGFPAGDSAVANQIRRLGAMQPRQAVETLVGTFFNYVPTMMFILLPVFAAVLKLLYIRRGRYYAEHFVFLLHVHSFVFLLLTVMLLLRELVAGWLEFILAGCILVYIYLALWRVYGQGWLKTFVKYWTLGWAYFWILIATMPLAFLATLLLF
jgi:hypothetical protein